MRNLTIVIAAFSALCVVAGTAASEPLQGKYNRQQVADACGNAGGRYWSNLDGYGCDKQNCDGKGGYCGVSCKNDGTCEGGTPQQLVRGRSFKNLNQVLGTSVATQPPGGTPVGPPAGGILDSRPGFSTTGPAPVGSGGGAPAAPPGKIY